MITIYPFYILLRTIDFTAYSDLPSCNNTNSETFTLLIFTKLSPTHYLFNPSPFQQLRVYWSYRGSLIHHCVLLLFSLYIFDRRWIRVAAYFVAFLIFPFFIPYLSIFPSHLSVFHLYFPIFLFVFHSFQLIFVFHSFHSIFQFFIFCLFIFLFSLYYSYRLFVYFPTHHSAFICS